MKNKIINHIENLENLEEDIYEILDYNQNKFHYTSKTSYLIDRILILKSELSDLLQEDVVHNLKNINKEQSWEI